jgi:hypothetical protein
MIDTRTIVSFIGVVFFVVVVLSANPAREAPETHGFPRLFAGKGDSQWED